MSIRYIKEVISELNEKHLDGFSYDYKLEIVHIAAIKELTQAVNSLDIPRG